MWVHSGWTCLLDIEMGPFLGGFGWALLFRKALSHSPCGDTTHNYHLIIYNTYICYHCVQQCDCGVICHYCEWKECGSWTWTCGMACSSWSYKAKGVLELSDPTTCCFLCSSSLLFLQCLLLTTIPLSIPWGTKSLDRTLTSTCIPAMGNIICWTNR